MGIEMAASARTARLGANIADRGDFTSLFYVKRSAVSRPAEMPP